jgi:hypothetical protein
MHSMVEEMPLTVVQFKFTLKRRLISLDTDGIDELNKILLPVDQKSILVLYTVDQLVELEIVLKQSRFQ